MSYTWAASFLLSLVAWYELRPVSVADAWVIGGLVLFELGLLRRKLSLRLQGYLAFSASFLRIFFVNLNASGSPGEISPRFYTVIPLALVFFYAIGGYTTPLTCFLKTNVDLKLKIFGAGSALSPSRR